MPGKSLMVDARINETRKDTHPTVAKVIGLLSQEYGPVRYKQRWDPVSELVGTILSQNTSDVNSHRAFRSLREAFSSWDEVMQGDVRQIADSIQRGGLGHIKAPRIQAVLKRIVEERGALDLDFLRDMPLQEAKEWLKKLPGVGPKTAAIVLCFSLGMPAMPVDTHVFRVAKRLGLVGPKTTAEQAHDLLEQIVPPEDVYPFHVLFITHGRRACKARRPLCVECVLGDFCPSRDGFMADGLAGG
jgi:endonuclease-3